MLFKLIGKYFDRFTMKVILLGLFITSWSIASSINLPVRVGEGSFSQGDEGLLSRRGELKPPPQLLGEAELNQLFFSEIKEQNADLKKVKYYLINGETRLAQVHLRKLAFTQTKLRPIVFRYLGILSFIEGNFQKSYEYLSNKELQVLPHFAKICTLKVINQIVLNKIRTLENEWTRCQLEGFNQFNPGSFIWIETLVQMKLKPQVGLTKKPFKEVKLSAMANDELKIFLKLALYLNQEKLIEPQLVELDLMQFEDKEIRELLGQVYFRLGALAKSYRFIEDLDSPNAENIKGNLYVLRNKYELAYAQFKLALAKKKNSQNAMERILPLAWLLGDWKEGAKISERVLASPQTQINKMTLVSAFYAQKGDYQKAKDVLETIVSRSRRGGEIDVTQLHSFVGLMQNKPEVVKKQADLSCAQFDMINCWLGIQMHQWDSFPLTIRRPDKIPAKKEWERLSNEEEKIPLQETVYVNQLDIEELDDKLIQLIPNAR
jgi:tetratricopeptide (TPR) repeat protein